MKYKSIFLRCASFILLVGALSAIFSFSTAAEAVSMPDTSNAESVCLYNVNTEKILYDKNLDTKIFQGSAVKMVTGLIACELLSDRLSESVYITEDMLKYTEGAGIKLSVGMTVTAETLLYGTLCGGGNDAASALAVHCSGSVDEFVKLMNRKAIEWGLRTTYFTNPTGLDDANMYSTLRDIITVAKRAYKNPLYLEISSAVSYVYTPAGSDEQIKMFNRNCLISTYYAYGYKNPRASGLIAGNTDLGGYCVITYAEKGDAGYLCAVMGAKKNDTTVFSYEIANALLSYAFSNYSYLRIAEKGQRICMADVALTMPRSDNELAQVGCVLDSDVYALTAADIDIESELTYRYYFHYSELKAPLTEGAIVGGVDIIFDGEIIGEAVLVTDSDIEASTLLLFLEHLRDFFSGRLFWLSILYIAIGLGGYYFYTVLRFKRKNVRKINYKSFY